MRRIVLVLAGLAAILTAPAVPASAAEASCVSAADATYRHSFDGAGGRVTITAVRPLCAGQTQPFALVSYTAGGFSAAGQFVYDTDRAVLGPARRHATLRVRVPDCYTQVAAIAGTAVRDETTSGDSPYGGATLGSATGVGSRSAGEPARYSGGTSACTAAPSVTFGNGCDGTLTATLSNGPSADIQAVFLTGSRRIHLSPGRSTTLTAARGRTLTIRDSSFTTYVGTWQPPATACPTATPTKVALPAPAASRFATGSLSASQPAGVAPSSFTPESPAPGYSMDATEPPATLASSSANTGSTIAVFVGLLMIGLGLAALVYLTRNSRRSA